MHKSHPAPQKFPGVRPGAFMLVEVMLQIILLAVGVLAVVQVISLAIAADRMTEARMKAVHLAQQKMEETLDSATFAGINAHAQVPTAVGEDYPDHHQEVIVLNEETGLKKVLVNVYWVEKGQRLNVSLATLVANVY